MADQSAFARELEYELAAARRDLENDEARERQLFANLFNRGSIFANPTSEHDG